MRQAGGGGGAGGEQRRVCGGAARGGAAEVTRILLCVKRHVARAGAWGTAREVCGAYPGPLGVPRVISPVCLMGLRADHHRGSVRVCFAVRVV